jgi:hypothetical protein
MNKKLSYQSLILVILVFLILIFVTKLAINKEGFNSENSKMDKIVGGDIMSQRNDGARMEALINSVDSSIEKSVQKQSSLRFDNSSTNNELMDKYIFENILTADENSPNKILESGGQFAQPQQHVNLTNYNHDMRKINITKQIKQDYLIKVLRHKIDLLTNSLKSIHEIKTDFETLKDPSNAHLVELIKKNKDSL